MKATARKLLALIMAMAMCLSLLQGVAFAAESSEEAPAEPEVVEVVEDEAEEEVVEEEAEEPKAEESKAEKKVETQSIVYVKAITKSADGKGFKLTIDTDGTDSYLPVGSNTDATKYYKWEDTNSYPSYVTYTTSAGTDNHIGADKTTRYTVSVDSKWINPNATTGYITANNCTVEGEVVDPSGAKYALTDAAINWGDELNEQQNWFTYDADNSALTPDDWRVKGWMYQEAQVDGSYKTFFKLTPVENGHFKTDVKDSEWHYFVSTSAKGAASLTRADDIRDALTDAQEIKADGTALTLTTKVDAQNYSTTPKSNVVVLQNENPDVNSQVWYNFGTQNAKNLDVTMVSNDVLAPKFTLARTSAAITAGLTGGSFELRVVKYTKDTTVTNATPVQTVVTDVDDVKTLLAPSVTSSWTLDSVVAGTGGYFTVSVTFGSDAAGFIAGRHSSNVSAYKVGTDTDVAGLTDLTKDGYYNATADNNAAGDAITIDANKPLYGPVIVKKDDIEAKDFLFKVAGWDNVTAGKWVTAEAIQAAAEATSDPNKGVAGGFMAAHYDANRKVYKFASLKEMKELVKNRYCIEDKTVTYTTLIMNAQKGDPATATGKANTGVAIPTSQTYYAAKDAGNGTSTDDWYTPANLTANADFIETKTYKFEKSTGHKKVKTVDIKDSTCKTPGTKVTKVYCEVCNKQYESESKTETIPVKMDNLVKDTKDNGYVIGANSIIYADASGTYYTYNANANPQATVFTMTAANQAYYSLIGLAQPINASTSNGQVTLKDSYEFRGPSHYIASAEVTTTNPTKEKAGTKTTVFKCNHGEIHDELTITEDITKKDLEHSGVWTYNVWTDPNTASVRNPAALYGYTVTVADYDVDDATLPILRNVYTYDNFGNRNGYANLVFQFAGADVQLDGTYVAIDDYFETGFGGNTATIWNTVPVWSVNGTVRTSVEKTYVATAVVKNIVKGEKECKNGSATIEVTVYELTDSFNRTSYLNATTGSARVALLEAAVTNKTASVVQTYKKDVVVPAEKSHTFVNGVCTICGDKDTSGSTVPETETKTDIATASFTAGAKTWTGKALEPTVKGKDADGFKLVEGTDFRVEDFTATKAGTYTVKVKGIGENYTGSTTVEWTVKKASQTIKVSPATKKLTFAQVQKAAQKFTIKVTGNKDKSKITFKSKNTKVATVNAKGQVTVKKATYKKAQKVVIEVKAGATGNVNASKVAKATVNIVKK